MKKNIYYLFFTLAFGLLMTNNGFGQRGANAERLQKKMKAEKIGFITSELELTEAEAIKFWPLYNEYEGKRMDFREALIEMRDPGNEADANKKLDTYLSFRENEYLLEKEYIQKYKQVIPAYKVVQLIRLEKKFKEELLKRVRQRMKNRER